MGGKVWLLKKAIYGLKQAAREFYKKLLSVMNLLGFKQAETDPCLFLRYDEKGVKREASVVHVDDGIVTGQEKEVELLMEELGEHLDIKYLGEAKYFLSLELKREGGRLWLGQEGYVTEILQRFGMERAVAYNTPMETKKKHRRAGEPLSDRTPYMSLVGALLYLASRTRPDISYAVGVLSRYFEAPTVDHWLAAKYILHYLVGTKKMGLVYCKGGGQAEVYGDSDFAACLDTRKSRGGVAAMKSGAVLGWESKMASTVVTSTRDAEIGSAAIAVKLALWLRDVTCELEGTVQQIPVYCDNQAAQIVMSDVYAGSGRYKHIEIGHHFVRERVARKEVEVKFVRTDQQIADVLTKPLPAPKLEEMRKALGVMCF